MLDEIDRAYYMQRMCRAQQRACEATSERAARRFLMIAAEYDRQARMLEPRVPRLPAREHV